MKPFLHQTARSSLITLLSLTLLAGCSSLPESLITPSENVLIDYASVAEQSSAVTEPSNGQSSQVARLGGVIAKVSNAENRTRIEMVNLPISSAGKPDINKEPEGRFVAYVDGFVDPVTFSEGRLITVLGRVAPSEKGKVEEFVYQYPVIDADGYHLWRIQERVVIHDTGSYLHNCRGIHCRGVYVSPSRQGTVIQEVR
ncbi:Slp family lipoprotein [Vibrio maerlii]|uniref:Slp family lipoprotein n=1 Tax=Vibrio maerlii TaxID=2231648 RepID=UPI000E3E0D8B|nr:Slp family lipoprotein [Vibrio maerlii]